MPRLGWSKNWFTVRRNVSISRYFGCQPIDLAPSSSGRINGVTVRDGANVADQYIVEHAVAGDIAITADVPLAAQLVAKDVFVLDPRGEVYEDRNIGSRLASRDWFDTARGAGMELAGPRPYSDRDRIEFASALDVS